MALSASDRNRIIQQSEAWLDSQFGGLDLSQYPALNPLPREDFEDDRFAQRYENPSHALRQFVRNPDDEALARVGSEIGSDELIEEVRDRRGGEVAREFKFRTPDYLPTDENYANVVAVLASNLLHNEDLDTRDAVAELVDRGYWTVGNLKEAWNTLKREGAAELPPGTACELTPQERLHVARMAQNGNVTGAIAQFLQYSLDEEQSNNDILYDPRYRKICDRATLYCFEAGQLDYTPTLERREFFRRFAAGRPLTVGLLQQAWAACQRNEASHERNELLGFNQQQEAEAPTQNELDALDDQSLDRLYHDSLRHYAKTTRRSPGILA